MITERNASKAAELDLKTPRKPTSPTSPNVGYQYLVGHQDILQITVWNHPELTNPSATANELSGRTVNPDGYIFFPYAGRIRAAGRTVAEIRNELTRKLSAYLVEPQVDVSVSNYRSKRVFVVGQVATPGPVSLTDIPLTITDLVAQSGGFTPEADLRNAALNRDGKQRPLDLYALYYQGDMRENLPLKPNDILTIPENRYNKVFVLGEVITPQSIVMPRGRMSLAEAISDAGGFNPLTANAGQVYVIRKGPSSRPQIWHLNSKSPDALILADSFDLQPRDIVYVDPAAIARWNRVISNLLPSASLVDTVNR
nr:polysaccharide biosynthesis/export family protein [Pseudomonas sp.]